MEKDVALGSVGSLAISFGGGKATVSLGVSAPANSLGFSASANVSASEDAMALVDKLFAAIEAASPAGAVVIEESVKAVIKAAVAGIQ